jgi:hypothetical protein
MASTSATFEMLYEQGEFMSSTNAPIRSLDPWYGGNLGTSHSITWSYLKVEVPFSLHLW